LTYARTVLKLLNMPTEVYPSDAAPASDRPAQPLRAGIIGLGFIGEVHARAIRAAGGVVSVVADATLELATAGGNRVSAQRIAHDAEELITSEDVDVVHICAPNHLHLPLARKALEAGKHVVCEKPLATALPDAHELVEAAAAAGVVATVPFVYRFYPTVREARARVADGEAGDVRVVHGSYLQDWLSTAEDQNWRVDPLLGGASRTFADIGVHWCDLVEFTTGHRIVALAARLLTAISRRGQDTQVSAVDTEDAASLIFETDGGAIGSLVVSQVSPGRKNRLWFSLDAANTSMAFDQESPETLWVGRRGDNSVVRRGGAASSAEAMRYTLLPAGHPQGYQDCFNAFVADTYSAVRGHKPEGLPTFADGLRAALITRAVLDSAASRGWVEVPS
jgi:predicted dehydrogenase